MLSSVWRVATSNRAVAVLLALAAVALAAGVVFVALSRRRRVGDHQAVGAPSQSASASAFSYADSFFSPVHDKYSSDQFTMGLRVPGGSWLAYPAWLATAIPQLQATHSARMRVPVARVRVKAVYFLRHGKGIHNSAEDAFGSVQWEAVEAKSDKYEDAPLNAVGLKQCATMRRAVRGALALRDPRTHQPVWRPQLIVTSPLTRAIETARLVFSDERDDADGDAGTDGTADTKSSGVSAQQDATNPHAAALASSNAVKPQSGLWAQVPVIALEDARETIGKNTCDRRVAVSVLRARYPNVSFAAEHFPLPAGSAAGAGASAGANTFADADPLWTPGHRETDTEIEVRAARLLNWLFTARPADEQHVVVSSHNGFISACLRVLAYPVDTPPSHFTLRNCEMVPLLIAYAVPPK